MQSNGPQPTSPLSYPPSCNGGSLHQMTRHCHCHLQGCLDMDLAHKAGLVMGDPPEAQESCLEVV